MSALVRVRIGSGRWQARAWIIFLVFGALTVLAAPINLLGHPPNPPSPERSTGLTAEAIEARVPGMADYIGSISRQMGNFMLAFGVLLMGVAAGPFRRGERWAWYVSWSVPLLLLIQLLNSRGGLGCGNSISAASLWFSAACSCQFGGSSRSNHGPVPFDRAVGLGS